MIRTIVVTCFKKFQRLECEVQERALIVGPNNSGKTTLLQAIATWAELGEIWVEGNAEALSQQPRNVRPVEIEVSSLRTMALSSFDELWHIKDTSESLSIRVVADQWNIGFELQYQDAANATVNSLPETQEEDLRAYARSPLRALYIPSLSGLDVHEPEYSEKVLATRLAHGKGGLVLRNLVKAVSRDTEAWSKLQNTLNSLFGLELAQPNGSDPIKVRYRHSGDEHWYDLVNGAAGFLQTVLVQSALLYSDSTLFLIDEPDAHLHILLKEKIYRLIREHCEESNTQALIATHSSRLIDEAADEQGQRLFLVTNEGLNPVRRKEAKDLLKIPGEEIVLAETERFLLYLEGKSDLDILREWARVLGHPALRGLESAFWIPTAEKENRNFAKRHYSALKAQVPGLLAMELRDRNGHEGQQWDNLTDGDIRIEEGRDVTPQGLTLAYWSRYETENYLIHPDAILRFVSHASGNEDAAMEYLRQYLPGVLFEKPFEATAADREKGKKTITAVMTEAGVNLPTSDFRLLAAAMKPEEIHPDVVALLNVIQSKLRG